jgi:hypothetical protein
MNLKKLTFIILCFAISIMSCRSNNNRCIESLMEEDGYSYEEALEACEEFDLDPAYN